jgi:hypothetical protein
MGSCGNCKSCDDNGNCKPSRCTALDDDEEPIKYAIFEGSDYQMLLSSEEIHVRTKGYIKRDKLFAGAITRYGTVIFIGTLEEIENYLKKGY